MTIEEILAQGRWDEIEQKIDQRVGQAKWEITKMVVLAKYVRIADHQLVSCLYAPPRSFINHIRGNNRAKATATFYHNIGV